MSVEQKIQAGIVIADMILEFVILYWPVILLGVMAVIIAIYSFRMEEKK